MPASACSGGTTTTGSISFNSTSGNATIANPGVVPSTSIYDGSPTATLYTSTAPNPSNITLIPFASQGTVNSSSVVSPTTSSGSLSHFLSSQTSAPASTLSSSSQKPALPSSKVPEISPSQLAEPSPSSHTSQSHSSTTSPPPSPPSSTHSSSTTPSPSPSSNSASSESSDAQTSSSDIDQYLQFHNTIRAQHGANALTWSDNLASKAQQWANGCVFKHSGGTLGPFGENLAAGTGSGYGIQNAVQDWTNEVSQYDPNDPQPSHFTQVVWKASTQVGCAVQKCSGIFPSSFGLAQFYVCEYSPQGNIIGQFPENVQV
ncbi:PR-1-like protein [Sistotremastrum suecicum HHB10207 ss-3]|uniref:PR-1-like protein n=1 Tax=Sistotremastrum suecicum HHB10207 ss-3 TaxID=1314776 RepID=A0A166EXD3_9AGAM|nr:PR-1-like protein [Sistotremastrum suecicum HHB10207 ss-3]